MRAPSKAPLTSRLDEVVAEIVDLLVSKGDTDKFAAEVVVRSTIQFLKEIAQKKEPLWGSKKLNADALSALLKEHRRPK